MKVLFWNVFYYPYDKPVIPSQQKRIAPILSKVDSLKCDAVGLAEVEDKVVTIIEEGLPSESEPLWARSNRPTERIGLLGRISRPSVLDLGYDNRAALLAEVGGVTIVCLHLTFSLRGSRMRSDQIQKVLRSIAGKEKVIIMGDFNALAWQRERRMLRKHGFSSAMKKGRWLRPVTSPAPGYRKYYNWWQKLLVGRGMSPDDIYVRGLNIHSSGVVYSESDHVGVWAEVS
ncbi:MAG: endonuclease/exonuclease/phosphatase family protein [Patescibacteria group bacterium]